MLISMIIPIVLTIVFSMIEVSVLHLSQQALYMMFFAVWWIIQVISSISNFSISDTVSILKSIAFSLLWMLPWKHETEYGITIHIMAV